MRMLRLKYATLKFFWQTMYQWGVVAEDELAWHKQRINWAWGNCVIENAAVTEAMVEKASPEAHK